VIAGQSTTVENLHLYISDRIIMACSFTMYQSKVKVIGSMSSIKLKAQVVCIRLKYDVVVVVCIPYSTDPFKLVRQMAPRPPTSVLPALAKLLVVFLSTVQYRMFSYKELKRSQIASNVAVCQWRLNMLPADRNRLQWLQ